MQVGLFIVEVASRLKSLTLLSVGACSILIGPERGNSCQIWGENASIKRSIFVSQDPKKMA